MKHHEEYTLFTLMAAAAAYILTFAAAMGVLA